MLTTFAVSNYRSLRELVLPLSREGGLTSTLWAGPETISRAMRRGDHPVQGATRKGPVQLRLGFAGDEFGYAIDLGLPAPSSSAFAHDPEIKRESVWSGPILRPSALLVDRQGAVVLTRSESNQRIPITRHLATFRGGVPRIAAYGHTGRRRRLQYIDFGKGTRRHPGERDGRVRTTSVALAGAMRDL